MARTTFAGPVASQAGFEGVYNSVSSDGVQNMKVEDGLVTLSDPAAPDEVSINLAALLITVPNIPTSDPSIAGAIWSNSGVLTVSAG